MKNNVLTFFLNSLTHPAHRESASFADIPSWLTNQNGVFATDVSPVNWQERLLFEIHLENKSKATPILVDDKLIFTAEPA